MNTANDDELSAVGAYHQRTIVEIDKIDNRIFLGPDGKKPLLNFTELDHKLYSSPSQEVNKGQKEGQKDEQKYEQKGLYTQRMTGKKIPTVAEGRIDPTIPEKDIDANDKAKPDGVLNEALPLFAGASVGTAFCFTALALGGVVPVITVGALLVLGVGGYEFCKFITKSAKEEGDIKGNPKKGDGKNPSENTSPIDCIKVDKNHPLCL